MSKVAIQRDMNVGGQKVLPDNKDGISSYQKGDVLLYQGQDECIVIDKQSDNLTIRVISNSREIQTNVDNLSSLNDNQINKTIIMDSKTPFSLGGEYNHQSIPFQELVGGKNQDYIGLSRIYKLQLQYQDVKSSPACVLCHKNICLHVLFPCEHRCVCIECINKESICSLGEGGNNPNAHVNCPLCLSIIKLILPFENGLEREKYWNWVEEVKPELPSGFLRNWKHSAAIIQKVYTNEQEIIVKTKGCHCIVC